jgi:hypothetical protein
MPTYCECGCGEPSPIAKYTNRRYGWVKGKPKRFVHGHQVRMRREQSSRALTERLSGRRGPEHIRWTGGRGYQDGYITVWVGHDHPMADHRGRAKEHRLVMAEHLDRPLAISEVVHHINGIKDDNRIENLMLFKNGSAHIKHHWVERGRS